MDAQLVSIFDPEPIIKYGGIALLLLIIFAESGLFFGFFLPGDSLLFVAGLMCESPNLSLSIWLLVILLIIAATCGTAAGYFTGLWFKPYLETRTENFFFKRTYLVKTEQFYHRYGITALIVGRFLPIVRTFVPVLAGVVRINFFKFTLFNFIGTIVWVMPLVLAGYWLGNRFPFLEENLGIIVLGMVILPGLVVLVSMKVRK